MVQPGLDCHWPNTKQFRGFVNAEPFNHAGDENCPIDIWQCISCTFNDLDYLPLCQVAFRIDITVAVGKMNDLRIKRLVA